MVTVDKTLVLRYVVPFSCAGDYAKVFSRIEKEKAWSRCSLPTRNSAVFSHLYQLAYGKENDCSIGSTWEFADRNKLPQLLYAADKDAEPTKWRIARAQIHLFHTDIGLLWYELEPLDKEEIPNLEELILLQNRFKECSYTDKYFTRKQSRRSKEEADTFLPFDAAKWLGQLLRPLGSLRYLNSSCLKDGMLCPDRALIFNYVLLRNESPITDQQLQTAAYWLANGYNRKYRPSAQALSEGVHPFADVCMYASRAGCGYYAVVNEGNRAFFTGNFDDSIRNEYFFLYILALYQSFSLMNFSQRCASEFSSDPQKYSHPGSLGVRLDAFVAELNAFLMKGMHSSVSSVQHHNDFYQYLRERLMIQEDIESLKIGTEALAEIQHARREHEELLLREKEAAEEKARDRRQNIALAVLSLFSLCEVFMHLTDLIDKLFDTNLAQMLEQLLGGNTKVIAQVSVHGAFLVIAAVCVALLISSFRAGHKEKSDKKENAPAVTEVVAALIWDGDKFMICQRPANKDRGLLWEFVGGKVEPGETKQQALTRECQEELGVTLSVGDVFMDVVHEYPDIHVHLTLYHATIADGEPQKIEHSDIQWITSAQIPDYDFCPADEEILRKISEVYHG